MPKRSSSPLKSFLKPLLRKGSITSLIAILLYALFELAQPIMQKLPNFPSSTQVPASNAPLQIFSNQTGDNLTQLYASAIRSAKQSITFVIYALLDPQIIEALKEKIDAKIPVYIVCDAKASPGLTRKLPGAQIVRRAGKGLMHQKILIIDDQEIWLGSSNMTTDSLRVHGNLVFKIDNPALAQALTAKAKSMDEDGNSTPLLHRQTQVASQNLELWILPDDPTADKRIIQILRGAKKSIKVAMFTWTRLDFTQELIDAAKRGVKVEAVVDRYSGQGASAKIVRTLAQSGIPVRLSTGKGLLHHKFAYIDDEILINGSANWTISAFKFNDDCFIVLYPLTPEQQDKMNRLWQVLQRESEPPGAAKLKGHRKEPEYYNED